MIDKYLVSNEWSDIDWEFYVFNCLMAMVLLDVKQTTLPPVDKMKMPILVLDLDETLVHSFTLSNIEETDWELDDGTIGGFYRPDVFEFLDYSSKHFRLVLFSAGTETYVEDVITSTALKPYFELVLNRSDTTEVYPNIFVKDLRKVNDKLNGNGAEILIIDNCLLSFAFNLSNGILISTFTGNKDDTCLKDMIEFLSDLLEVNEEMNSKLETKFCFYRIYNALKKQNS
jgi:TFIIF-interacting CTD phosphatase-like protein